MKQYLELCKKVLEKGVQKENRTGVDTIGYIGDMMQFDMADGFPLLTTKKMKPIPIFGEMLAFLRGYTNAKDFRKLGSNVWDANANKNEKWLANPHRKGTDDLGPIYGAQARRWDGSTLDQLAGVVEKLSRGEDDRRLIVSHWNPGALDKVALPSCHVMYQFGIQEGRLCLSMYQRSCDVPLGIPYNVAGYSWLLHVIAKISGLEPGVFTHFMHDIHIYVDQVDGILEQIDRAPRSLPSLKINEDVKTFTDLDIWADQFSFTVENYHPHPAITIPFAV